MSASGSSAAVSLSQAVGARCRRHGLAEFYVLRRAGGLAPFQRARHELVLSGGQGP